MEIILNILSFWQKTKKKQKKNLSEFSNLPAMFLY